MLPTLRTVLALPGAPVVLRHGSDHLDQPVRWVAVSELEDPTPYLAGGELVLTTGIRLTRSRADAYVRRLVVAEAAGLGLGVGLTHDAVPEWLLAAAEAHDLPLLEVPEPTPFIAVTKAVSDALAAAEYEAVTRAVEAQRDLTRAASSPGGAGAVCARLARVLAATVVLLDAQGRSTQQAPHPDPDLLARLAPEIDRLREKGGRSSAAFTEAGQTAVVQPLVAGTRVRGYLAVARPEPFAPVDHSLVNVAVALLSLAGESAAPAASSLPRLREAAVALAVAGTPLPHLPWAALGWVGPPSTTVAVTHRAVVGVGDAAAVAEVTAAEVLPEGAIALGAWNGHAVLVLDADADPATALPALGPAVGRLRWGVSRAVATDGWAAGVAEAERVARQSGEGQVAAFEELATTGVLGLVDPDAGRGFADSLLAPLDARDRGDLVASVRAWLAHHGQWDAAAAALGVHRHTLRYRMRRVEELLGRSLDDPGLRADLWVALALREQDAEA